jgi:hypothetical protein
LFLQKSILTENERPPMVIFQLEVVHNRPNKLSQKSMNGKLSSFVIVIHKPQNGASGIWGFSTFVR